MASTAVVVGDVRIGDHSSVWYHAVLRGDINYIRVGTHTNIQDGAVVQLADEHPCESVDWVTVGHSAVRGSIGLVFFVFIFLDGSHHL